MIERIAIGRLKERLFVGEGSALPFSHWLAQTAREPGGLPYKTIPASRCPRSDGIQPAKPGSEELFCNSADFLLSARNAGERR